MLHHLFAASNILILFGYFSVVFEPNIFKKWSRHNSLRCRVMVFPMTTLFTPCKPMFLFSFCPFPLLLSLYYKPTTHNIFLFIFSSFIFLQSFFWFVRSSWLDRLTSWRTSMIQRTFGKWLFVSITDEALLIRTKNILSWSSLIKI